MNAPWRCRYDLQAWVKRCAATILQNKDRQTGGYLLLTQSVRRQFCPPEETDEQAFNNATGTGRYVNSRDGSRTG